VLSAGKTIQAISLILANRKDPLLTATDIKAKAPLPPPPPPPPGSEGEPPVAAGALGLTPTSPLLRIKATLVVCPGMYPHPALLVPPLRPPSQVVSSAVH
jgi:hypothetical protein